MENTAKLIIEIIEFHKANGEPHYAKIWPSAEYKF